MYSDIKIATSQSPKDISELAAEIGLLPQEFDVYGKKKAKVSLKVLDRLAHRQNGSYVIVTGSVCWSQYVVNVSITGFVSILVDQAIVSLIYWLLFVCYLWYLLSFC